MENFKIILERENSLFSRKEIVAEIKTAGSPKRTDIETILSQKFSTTPDSVKVEKIIPKFSSDIFTIYAKIYKSADEKNSIEPKAKTPAVTPQ